jgi:hypothetical protein
MRGGASLPRMMAAPKRLAHTDAPADRRSAGGCMAVEGQSRRTQSGPGRTYSPQHLEKQLRLAASRRDHLADDFRHQGIRQDYRKARRVRQLPAMRFDESDAVEKQRFGAPTHSGIVGNRLFPGTLAFDDPAVMDELVLPAVSRLKHPGEGTDVVDSRIEGSFTRLLTSTLAVGIESGWIHRNWGPSQRAGFDTTTFGLKGLLYKNELHEVMISAGLGWGIGRSGAQGVGASNSDTLQPGIFFGKGFGDLPNSLSWLRPLAITGAVTLEHPMSGRRQTSVPIQKRAS